MKKMLLAFLPLSLAGFVLPDKLNKHNSATGTTNAEQYDGPYVLYKNNQVFAKYIMNDQGSKLIRSDSMALPQKESLSVIVTTDEPGKTFTVQLKKKLQIEKSEYKKVNKQMAISDIEGNFRAFRKLLQANAVIDSDFNWTFGEGHLVLTGDFFDRGNQVTEVLWLIYSLEEKAKQAGGYVHFILGNHEIMNMNGDLRYVQPKYKENAALLGERYEDLYGENSELGRWLRTKNIIEKVGDMLYTHGGVSGEINRMDISISNINELARPFYADNSYQYENKKQEIIYGDSGPFWYRGYYQESTKASPEQIDSTISKFNIRHIATGHTIVADTISTWYGGKVIDTDVHHAAGRSEALLIEGGKFYRVNTIGEKFLMME
ncbi:MAG TPA: metallophosphoesterase [Chitinophagaceae bacterium]